MLGGDLPDQSAWIARDEFTRPPAGRVRVRGTRRSHASPSSSPSSPRSTPPDSAAETPRRVPPKLPAPATGPSWANAFRIKGSRISHVAPSRPRTMTFIEPQSFPRLLDVLTEMQFDRRPALRLFFGILNYQANFVRLHQTAHFTANRATPKGFKGQSLSILETRISTSFQTSCQIRESLERARWSVACLAG